MPLAPKRPFIAPGRAGSALRLLLAAGIVAGSGACVTINIYFPAAAAEKAADRIIDEVWQLREGGNAQPGTPQENANDPHHRFAALDRGALAERERARPRAGQS